MDDKWVVFLDMLVTQVRVNTTLNGGMWLKGVNRYGKKIYWERCARMEMTKFIDCYPWKHWENVMDEPDTNKAKEELADIMGFVMSRIAEYVAIEYGTDDPEHLAALIKKGPESSTAHYQFTSFREALGSAYVENTDVVSLADEFIASTQCLKQDPPIAHIGRIMRKMGYSFDSLVRMYYAKMSLVNHRHKNGYAGGVYLKQWGTNEDTFWAHMYAVRESNPTYEKMEGFLQEAYDVVTGGDVFSHGGHCDAAIGRIVSFRADG